MKTKIVSIVGARPNFIKLAAIHREITKDFNHVIIHTGQHYDYSLTKGFFEEFNIPSPNYNLGVGSSSFGNQMAKMLIGCEQALLKLTPKMVIVYGDTNSTLAGAISASKLKIPLTHMESGARCADKTVPEETNRIIVDHLSDLLFAHSDACIVNLKKEGLVKNVFKISDPMFEILKTAKPIKSILKKLDVQEKNYYVLTIHREENTNDLSKFKEIIKSLNSLDKIIVFPAHPRSKNLLSKIKLKQQNIKIVEPLKFNEMIALTQNSLALLTDSGGLQKEAYWQKIPCFTFRGVTEWGETVDSGWNVLVGKDTGNIPNIIKKYKIPQKHPNYYSDGLPLKKINSVIRKYLS